MGERDYGGYDSHPPAAARFPLKKASTEKLFEYMNRVIYVTYDVKERRVAACPQLADYRDFPFSVLGNKPLPLVAQPEAEKYRSKCLDRFRRNGCSETRSRYAYRDHEMFHLGSSLSRTYGVFLRC